MHSTLLRLILLSLLLIPLGYSNVLAKECVVLLHGLARSAGSMEKLGRRLRAADYEVANIDYPSRKFEIDKLVAMAVEPGIQQCEGRKASRIHFVAHSLGGILVRKYLLEHKVEKLGRVVMLGPPNKGSEAVDVLKDFPGFFLLNGPAGRQLGTDSGSVPLSLGPVNFELGIIAGTTSINLILSLMLPNPDDGKVSLESTKVEGMQDFIALDVTHPFMMKSERVISQTISFLQDGKFSRK